MSLVFRATGIIQCTPDVLGTTYIVIVRSNHYRKLHVLPVGAF